METIKGTVTKCIFISKDSGYKVLVLRTLSGSPTIITGEFGPDVIIDTAASFTGEFRTHPKYGSQFKVKSYEITFNAEEQASIRIFIDNIAPNIGYERSQAIVSHFKDDTIRVLDEEPERLCEVPGIGKVSAESLKQSWKENREEWNKNREVYSLRAFLTSLGIRERRIKRILSYFGGGMGAEEKIRENPYILAEVDTFGFTLTDFIARKLGIPESAPERVRAFVIYLLEQICPQNGHLFLPLASIPDSLNKFCIDNSTKFLDMGAVKLSDIQPILNKLQQDEKIVIEEDCVYAKDIFSLENRSAICTANIMNEPSDLIFLNREAIEKHISVFEQENNFILSEEQKQALFFFAEHKVFIITGGPGTGKSSILKAIVELAQKMKINMDCMTPTGISAKKLSEIIKYPAYTIHRRLGFRGNEWVFNENNPFDTDLAIIDESSMVDQSTFFHLMSALRNRTHVIFVGDQDQLPSVGAGNVLKELINCNQIPTIRLTHIFRQEETSDIIKAAHKIKKGDTDLSLFKPDPKADVFFYRLRDLAEIEKIVVSLAVRFKGKKLFQIISPRNEGPLSVNSLNTILQETLNPREKEPLEMNCGNFILRRGDRIIIKKNDYENDIYNGDIGKVISMSGGIVVIEIDDRQIPLSVDELEGKIKLAYSITCHGCQGQEYPYIILPFINQFGRNMLQRNLLYTALTRAKEKVIVLGHGSALERAINNDKVTARNTKLGERIQKCLQKKKNGSSPELLSQPQDSRPAKTDQEPSLSEIAEYYPTVIAAK